MVIKVLLDEVERLGKRYEKAKMGNSLNLVCENEAIDLPLIQ
jgi:hypothetical protein